MFLYQTAWWPQHPDARDAPLCKWLCDLAADLGKRLGIPEPWIGINSAADMPRGAMGCVADRRFVFLNQDGLRLSALRQPTTGHGLFIADLIVHELVHNMQFRELGSFHGRAHGPTFRNFAFRFAKRLDLPKPVECWRNRYEPGHPRTWPHSNFKSTGRYEGFYPNRMPNVGLKKNVQYRADGSEVPVVPKHADLVGLKPHVPASLRECVGFSYQVAALAWTVGRHAA